MNTENNFSPRAPAGRSPFKEISNKCFSVASPTSPQPKAEHRKSFISSEAAPENFVSSDSFALGQLASPQESDANVQPKPEPDAEVQSSEASHLQIVSFTTGEPDWLAESTNLTSPRNNTAHPRSPEPPSVDALAHDPADQDPVDAMPAPEDAATALAFAAPPTMLDAAAIVESSAGAAAAAPSAAATYGDDVAAACDSAVEQKPIDVPVDGIAAARPVESPPAAPSMQPPPPMIDEPSVADGTASESIVEQTGGAGAAALAPSTAGDFEPNVISQPADAKSQEFENSDSKKEELRRKLANAEAELRTVQQRLEESQQENQVIHKMLLKLGAQNNVLEEAKTQAELKLRTLEDQVEQDAKRMQSECRAAQEKAAHETHRATEFAAKFEEMMRENELRRFEMDAKLSIMTEQWKAAESDKKTLKDELDSVLSDCTAVIDKVDKLEAQNAELQAHAAQLGRVREVQDQLIQNLEGDNNELKSALQMHAQKSKADLEGQLQKHATETDNLTAVISRLENQLKSDTEALQIKLAKSEDAGRQLHQMVLRAANDNQTLKQQTAVLQFELANAKSELTVAQSTLESKSQELSNLKANFEQLKKILGQQ